MSHENGDRPRYDPKRDRRFLGIESGEANRRSLLSAVPKYSLSLEAILTGFRIDKFIRDWGQGHA